ncbi:hypothetical protein D3C74_152320 [compost metagenome]
MDMTPEEMAATLAKEYGLNRKEQRLLAYDLDDSKSRNIGDMCTELKTTPFTLLGKTRPSLNQKMSRALKDIGR